MARNFNGTTDKIVTGLQNQKFFNGSADSNAASFCFSAWAYWTGSNSFPVIMGSTYGAGFIGLGNNIGNFSGFNAYINGLQTKNTTSIGTNVWHHVACRMLSAAGASTINVYIDGVDVSVGQQGGVTFSNNDTNDLNFGTNVGGNSFWAGRIAHGAVWTAANNVQALSVAEIVALSNGALPYQIRPGNLVGYWPLDGLASPEPDYSGSAFNGTLTGTSLAASGPPVMQFSPRLPLIMPNTAAAASFQPAWAMRNRIVVEGIGT